MTHPTATVARQRAIREAHDVGIDDAYISNMVDRFYARVQADGMLGPIFAQRITDWPHHLEHMKTFWRSIMLKTGEFSGNPMMKHAAIAKIDNPEFSHWLKLFAETLDELGGTQAARDRIYGRAEMIAESLLLGIHIHRDGVKFPAKMKG
ncbi:MAG: group III truncated hemoglobin [Pseudomonadota bacterium]